MQFSESFTNPLCPRFETHWENAHDEMFPRRSADSYDDPELTVDEVARIDAAAEAAYRECEGH